MLTTYQAMKAYRAAYRVTSALKHDHDTLVIQQKSLLSSISKAEADENKAREAMLRVIQEGNDSTK